MGEIVFKLQELPWEGGGDIEKFSKSKHKKKDKKNLVVFFAADTFILTHKVSCKAHHLFLTERQTHMIFVCEFYSCLLGGVRPAIRTNPPVKG